MSNYLCSNGDDSPDAASKNLEDATVLFDNERYDGAGYLAGYVIECVLKTIAQVEEIKVKRSHDLNDLSQEALRFITSTTTAKTAPYVDLSVCPNITTVSYGQPPAGWQETIRYCAEGKIDQPRAEQWVLEAIRLYDAVVAKMRRDGVITP